MDTLLRILRWVCGVLLLFMSLGAFVSDGAIPGSLILLGALILFPPIGALLGHFLAPITNHGPAFGSGFALFLIGIIWATVGGESDFKSQASAGATQTPPIPTPAPPTLTAPQQHKPTPSDTRQPARADVSTKISPNALMLIQGKGWDKTRGEWGSMWIKRINDAMPLAARKAAQSPECDYVEIAGLSDRSMPKKTIIFFVDCRNDKRFYVSEDDVKSSIAVVSKNAKTAAISDINAITACEDSAKSQLNYPSSFDRHMLDTSVYRAPTGNIAVDFSFDTKNALGAELPYRVRCIIDDTGIHPAEISAR